MQKTIISVKNLTKNYGDFKAVKSISFDVYEGEIFGLLGPNGAGKSTLLKIMAGIDKDYAGEAWVADGYRVGYLAQEPKLDASKTVFENVMDGLKEIKAIMDRFNEVSNLLGEVTDEDEMQKLIDLCFVSDAESRMVTTI